MLGKGALFNQYYLHVTLSLNPTHVKHDVKLYKLSVANVSKSYQQQQKTAINFDFCNINNNSSMSRTLQT